MTPQETISLLKLVVAYTPIVKLDDATPVVWHHALEDLPSEMCVEAVHWHFKSSDRFITVSDIRRYIAERWGMVPMAPEVAYSQAQVYADFWRSNQYNHNRPDAPEIDDLVLAAYRKVGSGLMMEGREWDAHRRFIEVYTDLRNRQIKNALGGNMPALRELWSEQKAIAS